MTIREFTDLDLYIIKENLIKQRRKNKKVKINVIHIYIHILNHKIYIRLKGFMLLHKFSEELKNQMDYKDVN